jgi:hypothetical protein
VHGVHIFQKANQNRKSFIKVLIKIKVQKVIASYELTPGIYLNLLAQLHYAFESLIQKQDGFISVVVNTNDAQTRIANYTQWENQDKFLVILRSTQSNFNVF